MTKILVCLMIIMTGRGAVAAPDEVCANLWPEQQTMARLLKLSNLEDPQLSALLLSLKGIGQHEKLIENFFGIYLSIVDAVAARAGTAVQLDFVWKHGESEIKSGIVRDFTAHWLTAVMTVEEKDRLPPLTPQQKQWVHDTARFVKEALTDPMIQEELRRELEARFPSRTQRLRQFYKLIEQRKALQNHLTRYVGAKDQPLHRSNFDYLRNLNDVTSALTVIAIGTSGLSTVILTGMASTWEGSLKTLAVGGGVTVVTTVGGYGLHRVRKAYYLSRSRRLVSKTEKLLRKPIDSVPVLAAPGKQLAGPKFLPARLLLPQDYPAPPNMERPALDSVESVRSLSSDLNQAVAWLDRELNALHIEVKGEVGRFAQPWQKVQPEAMDGAAAYVLAEIAVTLQRFQEFHSTLDRLEDDVISFGETVWQRLEWLRPEVTRVQETEVKNPADREILIQADYLRNLLQAIESYSEALEQKARYLATVSESLTHLQANLLRTQGLNEKERVSQRRSLLLTLKSLPKAD